MKLKWLLLGSLVALWLGFKGASPAMADFVSQGRSFLAVSNIVSANVNFSNAVNSVPADPVANTFYAVTRVLSLPLLPPASNFLTRWGVPAVGRNLYDWTARPLRDSNGLLIAPAGVDANEFTSLLRTNFLPAIIGAESNLSVITDTNFTLALTASDTGSVAVTLDYGDIQMLRAMLQASEYLIYNTYSWNLDAQLTVIRSLYANDAFSFAALFKDYPGLLTFASTNDLLNAKSAYTNGVNRYLAASLFIRERSAGETRLFNLDPKSAGREQNFRATLADLENSLASNTMVISSIDSDLALYAPAAFTATNAPRSFLPVFYKQGFIGGTLESTFGGTVRGIPPGYVESVLAHDLTFYQQLSPSLQSNRNTFEFPVYGRIGRGYVVESSTNFLDWTDAFAFVSFGDRMDFSTTNITDGPKIFYRVADRTDSMPPPPNDNFANATLLPGLGIVAESYNNNSTFEPGDPVTFGAGTVWWKWTATATGLAAVAATGVSKNDYFNVSAYSGGPAINNLTPVYNLYNPNYVYEAPFYPLVFSATAGTTYYFEGYSYENPGGIQLHLSSPPSLNVSSPAISSIPSATFTNIFISATASPGTVPLKSLSISLNGINLASTTNLSLSLTYSNANYGVNYYAVTALDALDFSVSHYFSVTVPPPNDAFANRLPLTGLPVSTTGLNTGATLEANEPNIAEYNEGPSVWWSWTSTTNGLVSVVADLQAYSYDYYTALGVFTGTSLQNLNAVGIEGNYQPGPAVVSFNAVAGVTYQIVVASISGAQGNITLSVIPGTP